MPHKTLIAADLLAQHLDDPAWVIVDCRFDLHDTEAGRRAYLEGHIPGARYAHLDHDLSGPPVTDHGRHPLPSPESLTVLFSRLGIDAGRQVVAYDDAGGAIAARLWWMLRYMEHDAVAVLDGGWTAWRSAGYPLEEGQVSPQPRQFTGQPRRERLVLIDELSTEDRLVDARDPLRYRGEEEPLDPVAGHIPGAVNHYYENNLDESRRFLSPQQLKRRLQEVHEDTAPQDVVYYCGSGVSACHNVLAHVHAGLPEGRLYVGSWSEWCSDPARPVATE